MNGQECSLKDKSFFFNRQKRNNSKDCDRDRERETAIVNRSVLNEINVI